MTRSHLPMPARYSHRRHPRGHIARAEIVEALKANKDVGTTIVRLLANPKTDSLSALLGDIALRLITQRTSLETLHEIIFSNGDSDP